MPDEPEQEYDQPDSPDGHPTDDADGDQPIIEPKDGLDSGPNGDDEAAGDDETPADETTDVSQEMSELGRLTVTARNRMTLGQLILHYPSRDVTVLLDGEAGLRMLKMFEQRREHGLADALDPELSSASAGWLVLDLDGAGAPLAMSWIPGLPTKRPRTTIDPAVTAA